MRIANSQRAWRQRQRAGEILRSGEGLVDGSGQSGQSGRRRWAGAIAFVFICVNLQLASHTPAAAGRRLVHLRPVAP